MRILGREFHSFKFMKEMQLKQNLCLKLESSKVLKVTHVNEVGYLVPAGGVAR